MEDTGAWFLLFGPAAVPVLSANRMVLTWGLAVFCHSPLENRLFNIGIKIKRPGGEEVSL